MRQCNSSRFTVISALMMISQTVFLHGQQEHPIQIPAQGVRVPVEIFENIVYVPVFVEGKGPFSFILDTGAGFSSFLDENVAQQLNLRLENPFLLGGAGNELIECFQLNGVQFHISELRFRLASAFTIPFRLLSPHWGRSIDGLLGADLFGHVQFSIDYENSVLDFFPQKADNPAEINRNSVPLTIVQGYIIVDVVVHPYGGVPIRTQMMVDTGLRITSFCTPFSKIHQLEKQSPKLLDAMTGRGIGGETRGMVGRVKAIEIGNFLIQEPVVSFSHDTAGALANTVEAGILGADVLSRFQIDFDYPKKRMILTETEKSRNPYEYDMLGVWFRCEGEDFRRFFVHYIIPGSPAERAGIRVGDRIVSIDGEPASKFDLQRLRSVFRRADVSVPIELQRQNQIITIPVHSIRMI